MTMGWIPGQTVCERARPTHAVSTAPPSFHSMFRRPAARAMLAGGTAFFVGNAMLAMAAAWLVVELTGSSFLAALVQTAFFLPMFLLALPAGVLADTTDRHRLLRVMLRVQTAGVALLAALMALGWLTAGNLLLLTFFIGCCTALASPSWNSALVDTVPRDELPLAITAVGIGYNGARAMGPAAAGWVYTSAGPSWVFAGAALGTLVLLWSLERHPPPAHPPSRLPAERLWGGMLSALRFARHSDIVLAQLIRTAAFGATGSALWALLPSLAQQRLSLGAAGFGFLMACMGGGAVLAGFAAARMRAVLGLERLIAACCLVFAVAMAVAAGSSQRLLVYPFLFAAGGAWMTFMSTFNTATQTSAPPWVRARASALHVLAALGAFAFGSALWGALSGMLGLAPTLWLAAAGTAGSVLLARPWPLKMGELAQVTQAPLSQDLFVAHLPDPEAGPIAVEIVYQVRADAGEAFLEAVSQLRGPRRRDGATLWRVYRDLSDPNRFSERFIVTSWADYLHQRARATVADQTLEEALREWLAPGTQPQVLHFIAER